MHRHPFDTPAGTRSFSTTASFPRLRTKMPSLTVKLAATVLSAVCLATLPVTQAAPAGSAVASSASASPTAPYASENPNRILWTDTEATVPQAVRGTLGASVLGPQNVPLDLQNADLLAPPSTDSGTVYVILQSALENLY